MNFDPDFLLKFNFLICAEFIFCHSGVFFAVLVTGLQKNKKSLHLWLAAGGLFLFYGLFILAMSSELIIMYTVLTISRVSGCFLGNQESLKLEIGKAAMRATLYLITCFAVLLSGFNFGIPPEQSGLNIESTGGDVNSWTFLNWGYWFYLLTGLAAFGMSLKKTK